jgi:glycine cleavage system regulatory protein
MAVVNILTVVARDRPGLIEALSAVVQRHRGNWVDSSMARLGGEFAGILRVTIPEAAAAPFAAELQELSAQGIAVTLHRDAEEAPESGHRARLELTGADQPGIVHTVSSVLAKNGVNIEQLETRVFSGSMNGAPLFSADADIVLPKGLSRERLCDELEAIAHDIMVEIVLRDASDPPAG